MCVLCSSLYVFGCARSPLYAHGIVSNGIVYVAGTVGVEDMAAANKTLCAGGVQNETRCALQHVAEVLKVVNATPGDIVDCTVFVGNLSRDYDALNVAWAEFFGSTPPARAAFGANGLAFGAAAEFKCLATLSSSNQQRPHQQYKVLQ